MHLEEYRNDLLEAVKLRAGVDAEIKALEYAFVCEIAARMQSSEEVDDFLPCAGTGTGSRNRKLRVDAYEYDERDQSLRLLIAAYNGGGAPESLTRTRAEGYFKQLEAFIEDSIARRVDAFNGEEGRELASVVAEKYPTQITRFRLYLISDDILSERVKDLPTGMVAGVPSEYHIWDVGRLHSVSQSLLGTEEYEIDLTSHVRDGLPCLMASQGGDLKSYMCVVPGTVLADLYDQFGSRLLEGNVRSFLNTGGKINREIQGTIKAEPTRFFVYNNGISATATDARVQNTPSGPRLTSVRYLQIVNGGQTTASLSLARRKGGATLDDIHVQMKLTVVPEADPDKLNDIIQKVAKYSNKQNAVSDADFFSNHPFHRDLEKISRRLLAPARQGAQQGTYWFYERARGQYLNAQARMTKAEQRAFQQKHPRDQVITKTDLAKVENSFRQLPHTVSLGAQKNFKSFADYVDQSYGQDGARFNNDGYFREIVGKTILFRHVEKLISSATWYEGGYRANIATYSVAKLCSLVSNQFGGANLDFGAIWARQAVSESTATALERIGRAVAQVISNPPSRGGGAENQVGQKNVTEWAKKKECWEAIHVLELPLPPGIEADTIDPARATEERADNRRQGRQDVSISYQQQFLALGSAYWFSLFDWSKTHSPLFGRDLDLVRNAVRPGWLPSPKQARCLLDIRARLEEEGFRAG